MKAVLEVLFHYLGAMACEIAGVVGAESEGVPGWEILSLMASWSDGANDIGQMVL